MVRTLVVAAVRGWGGQWLHWQIGCWDPLAEAPSGGSGEHRGGRGGGSAAAAAIALTTGKRER